MEKNVASITLKNVSIASTASYNPK